MQNSDYHSPPPVEGVAGGGTGYGWNDASFKNARLLSRVVDVSRQPTSDLLHVWCMPSTATLGHQEPPRPLEQISLLVARNERESAQIALRPKVSWAGGGAAGNVQIHCSNLRSSSGHELETGNAVSLRRVVPILGVPDALVPLKSPTAQISLLPGETSALWLSITVPISQPPGLYEGEITITAVKADTDSGNGYESEFDKEEIKKVLQDFLAKAQNEEIKSAQDLGNGLEEICVGLRQLLQSPILSSTRGENGSMDVDEDWTTSLAVRIKLNVTVWDFVLPITPSLPAVFGISETVIEDRYGVEHGSDSWYSALDLHYKWLLQYRISPYFCRWGDNMRVLTYTCPWPAHHPKAEEYYSDPRLAAYAVPYSPVLTSSYTAKESIRRELEILKTKQHWKKAYFYLWDETRVQASTISFSGVLSKLPEVGVRGLYRGSIPAILGQFSSHGLRTGIFEASKLLLINMVPTVSELQVQSIASFCSTVLGTAIRIPCEVLKQRLQAGLYQNVGEACIGTFQQDGLKGFFRGTGVTLCREVPFYVAGMGIYEEAKKVVQKLVDRELAPWETIAIGGISGGLAAVCTTPFDVLKTRTMTAGPGMPLTMSAIAIHIMQEEGVLALFKGALPRFFWIAPLGAMNFAGYELAKRAMAKED
ncbi:hypothetical protein O6H91_17G017600 [Diphasiastrum complanatum]|uniref:Uncharacterized protein n=1 Tax=Diphasiastrum complanatum TaxID=34168 RepID=A0ACC2B4P9_DIPCM|nr:hypothetical protein O6H91_17G017600 [Diphasiastrum complanatum]